VKFRQFSISDRISHGADIARQCVPGGMTSMGKRTLAEPRVQSWWGIVHQRGGGRT